MVTTRVDTEEMSKLATGSFGSHSLPIQVSFTTPIQVAATSGIFEIWTEDTGTTWNSCSNPLQSPCDISETNHKFFWLPIYDGGETCLESPVVPSFQVINTTNANNNTNATYRTINATMPAADCAGTLSGIHCSVKCPNPLNLYNVEDSMLVCRNGSWSYNFTCSSTEGETVTFLSTTRNPSSQVGSSVGWLVT
jgi:hypothetical protein